MRLRSYGSSALLVDQLDDPSGWADGLRHLRVAGVVDVRCGEGCVLVVVNGTTPEQVGARLDAVTPSPATSAATIVTCPVRYDGDDIERAAAALDLSVDDVAFRHAAGRYRVEFCGGGPGFGIMPGVDRSLQLPDRADDQVVPAGAVLIVRDRTAIAPTSLSTRWHWIGRTDLTVWDPHRDPPALLTPGARVEFRQGGR